MTRHWQTRHTTGQSSERRNLARILYPLQKSTFDPMVHERLLHLLVASARSRTWCLLNSVAKSCLIGRCARKARAVIHLPHLAHRKRSVLRVEGGNSALFQKASCCTLLCIAQKRNPRSKCVLNCRVLLSCRRPSLCVWLASPT